MSNTISIIIPVYNEKESLEELYSEIRSATGSFSKREVLLLMMAVQMEQQNYFKQWRKNTLK